MSVQKNPKARTRKRRLKEWMLARGWKEADFRKGGEFAGFGFAPTVGKSARRAVRAMQMKARLPVTGKFDCRTLDSLFPGRVRRRFRRAMVRGYRQIRSVREEPLGSNWGPMVKKILAHVGFTVPAAWCCATVWYVADLLAGYNGPKQTGSRAYVPHLEEWAKDRSIVVPLRKSRAGMVVTYCWDGVRRGGEGDHVGVLLAPAWGVAIVRTGGGNEQDRVMISVHRTSQINCVIDLARLQKP
jgi:hypothetical protein